MKPPSQPTHDFEIYEGGPFKADSIWEIERQLEIIIRNYCRNLGIEEIHRIQNNFLPPKNFLLTGKASNLLFHNVVTSKINSFFSGGLKKGELNPDTPHDFLFHICTPSDTSFGEIQRGEILGVLGVEIKTQLEPRYKYVGDTGEYSFVFEIIIKNANHFRHGYFFHTRIIKKSDLSTTQKDNSIERSRAAHRKSLMRILQGGAPGLGQR